MTFFFPVCLIEGVLMRPLFPVQTVLPAKYHAPDSVCIFYGYGWLAPDSVRIFYGY